ncbi:MAG: hypothetical protein JOY60_13090 [Burkholderiaceae bacterium]|nr:hypothetical protein [Roseateles sp.]MBV8470781.1 hypothetical protein [Burkholderiaceae bacterium]
MPAIQISIFTLAALLATVDQAAPLRLSETELSIVSAGDNSNSSQPPTATGVENFLAGLFGPASLQASTLTPPQFRADMATLGLVLPVEFYADQAVTEITIRMAPISVQMNLASLLSSLTPGASQSQNQPGPSMGSVSLNNLNATGTRVYIWSH